MANLEKGKTLKTIRIPIKERPKPMIPHSPEDEQLFREVLEQCESVQQAVLQTSEDAKKTNADVIKVAEDRKKVEAIAGVVTSVEEQIEELEQISQQLKNDAEQINSTVQEVKTASANAIAENSYAGLQEQINRLFDIVNTHTHEIAKLKGGGREPQIEPEEYPEYVQPTGAHDAYHKDDKRHLKVENISVLHQKELQLFGVQQHIQHIGS